MAFVEQPNGFLMPPPMSGSQLEFLARNKPAETVTSRPASSALLCIDSEDRFRDYEAKRAAVYTDYNGSPYDFQITKNESMMSGFMTRLGVTEVTFPWVIPNINPYTSKIQVGYSVGGAPTTTVTIELVEGFYTPKDIAATLQIAIRAQTGIATFVMTYGADDLPNFQYAGNPGVAGTSIGFQPMPYNSAAYPYGKTTKQLFDLLGFSTSVPPNLTGNNIVQDAQVAPSASAIPAGSTNKYFYGGDTFAQSIRYIDIVCSQLTYNQGLKDTMSQTIARDTLCRLYIAQDGGDILTSQPNDVTFSPIGTYPTTIHRQFAVPKYIQWTPNQPVPGGLRFEVYDDAGNNLIGASSFSTQYSDWSMTLLVSEN
jgi:hypothetical protein